MQLIVRCHCLVSGEDCWHLVGGGIHSAQTGAVKNTDFFVWLGLSFISVVMHMQ